MHMMHTMHMVTHPYDAHMPDEKQKSLKTEKFQNKNVTLCIHQCHFIIKEKNHRLYPDTVWCSKGSVESRSEECRNLTLELYFCKVLQYQTYFSIFYCVFLAYSVCLTFFWGYFEKRKKLIFWSQFISMFI